MKQIKNIFLALLLFTLGACDDFLTQLPETAIPEDMAMDDLVSAEETVIGIYSCFKNPNLYSGTLVQAPDIQADLVQAAIGYSNRFGDFYRWTVTPNDDVLLNVYGGLYEIIARCNFFFDHVETVRAGLKTEAEKALMDKYEADAGFMRALAYSDLIRTFCEAYEPATAEHALGVPLYLHYREGNGSTVKKPRASLQASYEQVLNDLDRSEKLSARVGNDAMYVTQGAIAALKARVYLYMQNWEKAEEYATDVIEAEINGERVYRLADVNTNIQAPDGLVTNEYAALWKYDSASEIIFKISFSTNDMGGSLGTLFMGVTGGLYNPNYVPAQWLVESYSANDARKGIFFSRMNTIQNGSQYVIMKYPGNPVIDGSAGKYYTNMPKVLRLSEIYLIRAEARAMQQNTTGANQDLTTLRRARIDEYGSASHSQDKLMEEIRNERAKELCIEGFRLADLKRWKKGFERQPQNGTITGEQYSSLKVNGSDKRFTWLIPQHEITASQGLVIQNEQ